MICSLCISIPSCSPGFKCYLHMLFRAADIVQNLLFFLLVDIRLICIRRCKRRCLQHLFRFFKFSQKFAFCHSRTFEIKRVFIDPVYKFFIHYKSCLRIYHTCKIPVCQADKIDPVVSVRSCAISALIH